MGQSLVDGIGKLKFGNVQMCCAGVENSGNMEVFVEKCEVVVVWSMDWDRECRKTDWGNDEMFSFDSVFIPAPATIRLSCLSLSLSHAVFGFVYLLYSIYE
jgi:hypothetical protein